MKVIFAWASLCLLLLTAGCAGEGGYGGAYGVEGEYPGPYYAPVPMYSGPAYAYPYPYMYGGPVFGRGDYFDRHHNWDWHGHGDGWR